MGSPGRCPGPAAMPVRWRSLPSPEMEEESAALSRVSAARILERQAAFPMDPHGSETPQPWAPADCVPRSPWARLLVNRAAVAMSGRIGWLVLSKSGKCRKEMRLLQTSLLRQISGPMWKFVLCAGRAKKHLRKSLCAFSCQPPSTSAEQPAVEVPGAQEQPWQSRCGPRLAAGS